MLFTTVIPTIGRATLSRAVLSVLEQQFTAARFEVVVVNDSGQPLPEQDWQRSELVRIIDTSRRERTVARNAGAAMARGQYLHFIDDDDWLLPGALAHFWDLACASDAAWLYGSSQLVDRAGQPLIILEHRLNGNVFASVMAGEWIPLQSSMIRSDGFFQAGGFNPRLTASDDIDLGRRLALHCDVAGTSAVVACIGIGREGSSTDQSTKTEQQRWSREVLLRQAGVLPRLLGSARSSTTHTGYWFGRIARVYLTSLLWNLWRKRGFDAASRAVSASAAIVLAGRHLCSAAYWRALCGPYRSFAFERGLKDAGV